MSQEQWPTGHPLEAVIAMVETLAAEQKDRSPGRYKRVLGGD